MREAGVLLVLLTCRPEAAGGYVTSVGSEPTWAGAHHISKAEPDVEAPGEMLCSPARGFAERAAGALGKAVARGWKVLPVATHSHPRPRP